MVGGVLFCQCFAKLCKDAPLSCRNSKSDSKPFFFLIKFYYQAVFFYFVLLKLLISLFHKIVTIFFLAFFVLIIPAQSDITSRVWSAESEYLFYRLEILESW